MRSSIQTILQRLDPPVWIVTGFHDHQPGGLVATFVMNASIVDDDPRMIVGLARQHHTHELVDRSGRAGLHLLRPDQTDLAIHFGTQSGRTVSKFDSVPHRLDDGLVPVLHDCAAFLAAEVEDRFDTGDRTLFLCRIVAGHASHDSPPMTTSQLIESLTAEQLARFRSQRVADAEIDRRAIQKWRAR